MSTLLRNKSVLEKFTITVAIIVAYHLTLTLSMQHMWERIHQNLSVGAYEACLFIIVQLNAEYYRS